MYILPRLNQVEIENMNRPITSRVIESVILKLPNKTPGPDGFTGDFYQTFRRKYSKMLQKKEHFQTHSMRPASP